MHTGDGIERVSEVESLLTPLGGEGGSVPQALGSKGEERAKRRKNKKDSYAVYLESPTWRKIRAKALKRDNYLCRACREKAEHVHHIRYPQNLGQEKMEWLYSLCAPCHNAIHRAAKTMTLKKATELILASPQDNSNVTYLPDRKKKIHRAKRRRVAPVHVAADRRKKSKLEKQNDELREIFKANKERRERRNGG